MATYKRNNEKTENPRVSGSIPLQATKENSCINIYSCFIFFSKPFNIFNILNIFNSLVCQKVCQNYPKN